MTGFHYSVRKENTTRIHYKDQLIMCREITAVYSENHTKPIHTLCGQNAEVLNIITRGRPIYRHSYHSALKGCATKLLRLKSWCLCALLSHALAMLFTRDAVQHT
jgi:hypothetical protein